MVAPEAAGIPARPQEIEAALEPIECGDLDAQHVRWLTSYVAYCQTLLGEEQASASPDLIMVGYLKREILRYQRLLATAPATPA